MIRTEKLNPTQYQLAIEDPISASGRAILFDLVNSVWVTNTVRMAQALGKSHKDLMRNFKKQHQWSYDALVVGRNIQPGSYLGGNGESRPMWLVDERAFSVILTSMTGTKANIYVSMFISEYYKMFNALTQQQLESINISTQLVDADLRPADLTNLTEHTIDMSTFANSLHQASITIGRTQLYGVLRDMGLVVTGTCEPTELGLEYLTLNVSVINMTTHRTSKVRIASMAELVVKIQNHYIDSFIYNNNLVGLIHVLQKLMQENPNMSNQDLINYLQNNLPALQKLAGN